ncbi:polysaccharide biosynthesis/export family protein [Flavobacterium sp.]|jgi:polysaccharide export outer membrane protein|uniref:polysaccharide biosynthesis/export family protein n=1 Tax=Flavobacterium sp. TaxID=239 RepID=UPI0037BFFE5F
MNKSFFSIVLLVGIVMSSCVPQKDLQYLQKKEDIAATQSVNAIAHKPYRVQTNDVLVINIKTADQKLSNMFAKSETQQAMQNEQSIYFDGFTVNDHGNIRIPVLGEINVMGYMLEEIRMEIEKRLLEEYFKQEVNLFVSVKLGGLRYTINGEVNEPGAKLLFQEKVTIMEAIANARDITMVGDRKNVLIVRQLPQGTEMHTVDLTDAAVLQSPYYYIQPNDYILVHPLKQKSWGTGATGIQSLTTIVTLLSLVTSIIILTTL